MKTFLGRESNAPVLRGVVPTFTAKGKDLDDIRTEFVPWHQSTRAGKGVFDPIEFADIQREELEMAREKMREGLPPIIRTSAREKTRKLAGELHDYIQRALRETDGKWTPPRSLLGKIVEDSWRQGDPITYADAERLARICLERTQEQGLPTMTRDLATGHYS